MKKIIVIVSLILLLGGFIIADIAIVGKKEMIEQATLIAHVEIKELTAANKSKSYGDLIAVAYIQVALKGKERGEITFRIPRFFPCAAFDVSTGQHMVFLAKNKKGEYEGVNWYMSYLYLDGKTVSWYNEKGLVVDTHTPDKMLEDLKSLLKKTAKK